MSKNPTMSKKNFELLANELWRAQPAGGKEGPQGTAWRGWWLAVQAAAVVCRQSNINFSSDRFYQWCMAGRPKSKTELAFMAREIKKITHKHGHGDDVYTHWHTDGEIMHSHDTPPKGFIMAGLYIDE